MYCTHKDNYSPDKLVNKFEDIWRASWLHLSNYYLVNYSAALLHEACLVSENKLVAENLNHKKEISQSRCGGLKNFIVEILYSII